MQPTTVIKTIVVVAICLALCFGAQADEIHLTNGDRFTGHLVQMAAGNIVFKTDYAGALTIAYDRVDRLVTDDPVQVTFTDGTTSTAHAFYSKGGEDLPAAGETGIDLSAVATILSAPEPAVTYKFRANAGVSSEKGNTDTERINLDADAVARTRRQRFNAGGEISQERADDAQTADNWVAYGNYNYYLSAAWFVYASVMAEHDAFADLNLKTTLGAGGGHQFFESPELNLSMTAGLARVEEDYIVAADNTVPSAQWGINYDQYFFDNRVQLFHRQTGTVGINDANNWAVKTRQGIRVPIYKGLTTTLQYNFDWNNNPSPEAKEKWDSKILFLLGYTFGNE